MIKKISFIFAALWLLQTTPMSAADGQTLTINGVTVEKTVTKITFNGDQVVLHFADTTTQTADMEGVVLSFGDASSIQNLATFTLRGLVGSELNISGLKEGSEVFIYNAAGKLMLRSKAAKFNVSHLKKGIYVLKADNQVVKFVKR